MRYLRERQPAIWSFAVLLLLSGCSGTESDCNSSATRVSVIKIVSDNSNNALVDYAVRKSDAVNARADAASTSADKSEILEKARRTAVYRLGDTITTNSKSKHGRAATCTATVFATVEGATAQKQMDFKVERRPDGTLSVSVTPFQFEAAKD
jgi:hypothetical protein